MKSTSGLSVLILILAAAGGFADDSIQKEDSFGRVVRPFIQNHCVDCHSGDSSEAGVDLSNITSKIKTKDDADHWLKILEQLQTNLMPPLSEPRIDTRVRVEVSRWIQSTVYAGGFGEAHRRKMLLPAFGNYVDHDLLFSGEIKDKAYTPARIWRFSPYQFANQRKVGKIRGIQNPFTFSTPDSNIRDYSSSSDVGSSVVETIILNANAEIEYLLKQARDSLARKTTRKSRTPALAPFVSGNPVTKEQLELLVRDTFKRLVSRYPNPDELKKYTDLFFELQKETSDPERSVNATIQAIYLSPEAIYRMEWGLGETDTHGRRKLSPREIAFALSYALFDQGPFDGGRDANRKMIQQALEENRLRSSEQVKQVVEAILKADEFRPIGGKAKDNIPRIMRFFREFFGYHRAVDVFKDQRRVNEHGLYHSPRRLVSDADNLIKVILREDQQVFERLLTTREILVLHDGNNQSKIDQHNRKIAELEAYDEESARKEIEKRKAGVLKKPKYKANPKLVAPELARIEREGKSLLKNKKAELAKLKKNGVSLGKIKFRDYRYIRAYNLDTKNWKWPSVQPFNLPADQRAGILTHPAWLAAHSTNDDNHPILRGIWVYEKLLAGVIGDVPPSVDARIPDDPHKTLRQRLQVVRDDNCWKCHYKMNPLGEAFEAFDDFGRYRSVHYFDQQKNLTTRSAKHVLNDENKEVIQAIDRERLVREGKYTSQPVVAGGSFDGLGIAELNGEFENAIDMIQQIAKTKRARQSIIRHLFRFLMGRNEMLSDSQTLIDADQAYVKSNGSFRAVVVSLLSSDSFLYRR